MAEAPRSPSLDDRSYRELFAEAVARIPVHTPEWTNHNDADPGITLLQLWAYMAETLVYRANLIPERNRLAFLRLLGVERRAARAATGIVSFDNRRGPLEVVPIERDLELAAGTVPFRTEGDVAVLPIESRSFVKRRVPMDETTEAEIEAEYGSLYASFAEPGVEFEYYETAAVDWGPAGRTPLDLAETVDGALWLALLARPGDDVELVRGAIGNSVLSLGIVPDLTGSEQHLPPSGTEPLANGPDLVFEVPDIGTPLSEDPGDRRASYVPLASTGAADLVRDPGVVKVDLPPRASLGMWALDPTEDGVGDFPPALEGDDAAQLVSWLRIRPETAEGEGASGTSGTSPVRLTWVGINATMVRQRSHVASETLGRGSGLAEQTVQLANTPVLLDGLRLTVGGERWRRVDDLTTAGPEAPLLRGPVRALTDGTDRAAVYTIERATGTVRFGDGVHGRRPPPGAVIEAAYDHGGGRAGVVAAGAISRGTRLPAGVRVTNPLPTWGGDEPESVEEAEKRIPGFVRHRDRLVTADDYREIVLRTPGIDLGRVEVLPVFDPALPDIGSPGAVTLMLIPRYDASRPDAPEPDRTFLDAVCAHLDPRRLVTTELHLRGPDYQPVWVSIGVEAQPGRDVAVVRESVKRAVRSFLSPLGSGNRGPGWPLSTDVERLAIWVEAARVDGVGKVVGVRLSGRDGVDADRVEISGLGLPRLAGLSVRRGVPQSLDELRGGAPPAGPPRLPIPYVPEEC
jgi:hypothetical protein